ncbi:poly-beta-1,6-N-acetyl-D-glucosamine biosynthesis protein PgaD [Variovorax sp. OK605]|jgi:poly-beta-1,6-N-acetyl-D-glucosamine biosynthesis protein PgaD|nr:poly-beta-1,6-N-acetyl-D-glucosamine biosynthesis protein PgaD [Variovorax sp. OK605]
MKDLQLSVPSTANEPRMRAHTAEQPAPPRLRGWAEPQAETPVLDAARVPLSEFIRNKPMLSAVATFAWLRVGRPVLLVLFWVAVFLYAWRHFFHVSQVRQDNGLLAIYALCALGIFAAMLLLAPVRRRAIRGEETEGRSADSTVAQLAEYSSLEARNLSLWQRARRLLVQHDRDGRVTDASDLDTEPAMLTPSGTIARPQREA